MKDFNIELERILWGQKTFSLIHFVQFDQTDQFDYKERLSLIRNLNNKIKKFKY